VKAFINDLPPIMERGVAWKGKKREILAAWGKKRGRAVTLEGTFGKKGLILRGGENYEGGPSLISLF